MVTFFDKMPNRFIALVIGTQHSDKSIFAQQFLVDGIKSGERGLVIISNNFFNSYISDMKKIYKVGSFPFEKNMVNMIDCYSAHVGMPMINTDAAMLVSGPSSLDDMSSKIINTINYFCPSRIVFDSMTPILLNNNPSIYEKFFHLWIEKIRKFSIKTLILVDSGVHSMEDIAILRKLTSPKIYFKEKNKYIEIVSKSERMRISYKFDGEKIIFEGV